MSQENNNNINNFEYLLHTIENDLTNLLNTNTENLCYNNKFDEDKQTIPVKDSQSRTTKCNNYTKSRTTNCKLYTFLPEYTSARPFISHQNRWEQVAEINKQYIDAIMNMYNANSSQQEDEFDDFETILHNIRTGKDTDYQTRSANANHDNSRREWVNSPQHYKPGIYETWRIINEYELDKDFYLATALRYILRAGKKYNNKFAEDLRKAVWYLNKRASMWEQDNEL